MPNKNLTIVLDPAHGRNVAGKQSPDGLHKEYLWSRSAINALKQLLIAQGFPVFVTALDDLEPGLMTRVRKTNAVPGKKLFISLHNNAAGNGSQWLKATGVEIWTTSGQPQSDVFAEILMREIHTQFPKIAMRTDMSDGDLDKEENFTVLMCSCPAVLIEWLFQNNHDDVALLNDPATTFKLCQALVAAIIKINDQFYS